MRAARHGWQRIGRALAAAWLGLAGAAACGGDDAVPDAGPQAGRDAGPADAGREPVFPADFAEHYPEVRDCRHSHEHELRYIRVMVSESAREPYARLSPDTPYPVGATLVKLEYDDPDCAELVEYTAYRKLPAGENPPGNDWLWQRVSPERVVVEQGAPWTCITCHKYHCAPPYGYDLTCAEEL